MLEAFTHTSRGQQMVCLLHYQNEETKGKKLVLFKHGFMGHKITAHRMEVNFDHLLVAHGYTVARFDCAGAGDSEGDCHFTTIRGELEDTLSFAARLKETLRPEQFFLHGYSMGGCVASLASRVLLPDGILLWAPVSAPYPNFRFLLGEARFQAGLAGQDVDFLGDRVPHEFFERLDGAEIDPLTAIREYRGPVRIVQGDADVDVQPCNGMAYAEAAQDGSCHLVAGATHYFDTVPQQEELFASSLAFLQEMTR